MVSDFRYDFNGFWLKIKWLLIRRRQTNLCHCYHLNDTAPHHVKRKSVATYTATHRINKRLCAVRGTHRSDWAKEVENTSSDIAFNHANAAFTMQLTFLAFSRNFPRSHCHERFTCWFYAKCAKMLHKIALASFHLCFAATTCFWSLHSAPAAAADAARNEFYGIQISTYCRKNYIEQLYCALISRSCFYRTLVQAARRKKNTLQLLFCHDFNIEFWKLATKLSSRFIFYSVFRFEWTDGAKTTVNRLQRCAISAIVCWVCKSHQMLKRQIKTWFLLDGTITKLALFSSTTEQDVNRFYSWNRTSKKREHDWYDTFTHRLTTDVSIY